MKNIIHELYYGNLNPNENCTICDRDTRRAAAIIGENEQKLSELLTGKEKMLFLELQNAWGLLNGEEVVLRYTEGFETGFLIGVQCCMDMEDLLFQ